MWRVVRTQAVDGICAFLNSSSARTLIQSGRLIASQILDQCKSSSQCPSLIAELSHEFGGGLVLSHERIDFVSFPYEWPPEMLYQAGSLTLRIAMDVLKDGFGLKDATPYNVLFRGPSPVFIDLLSFERRDAGDPTWLPLAQFERTFLLPLLANKFFGLRLDHALVASRDGIEPQEIYRLLNPLQKARPFFLAHVCMPTWLGGSAGRKSDALYQRRSLQDGEKALFILQSLLKRLRKDLEKVKPAERQASNWSRYMDCDCAYSPSQFAAKENFLREIMTEYSPKKILDIGCNIGHFSAIAARSGAQIVAIDQDVAVVSKLWRTAQENSLNILPLVVDLARPSPAIGWLNQECASFLERARGHFDAVMALAVLHHMLVNERVPLRQTLQLFADLTKDLLVIEFIAPQDPMFKQIARGRDDLFRDLNIKAFERVSSEKFEILHMLRLANSDRTLYLMRKR